jgi:hypothetical protein
MWYLVMFKCGMCEKTQAGYQQRLSVFAERAAERRVQSEQVNNRMSSLIKSYPSIYREVSPHRAGPVVCVFQVSPSCHP